MLLKMSPLLTTTENYCETQKCRTEKLKPENLIKLENVQPNPFYNLSRNVQLHL